MTELELVKQQRTILLEALKTIATNTKTPKWISELCKREVTKARSLSTTEQEPVQYTGAQNASFEPGDIVRPVDETDKCVYQIVSLSTNIEGVNLWNIRILKGDRNNPVGFVVSNVPETKFHK